MLSRRCTPCPPGACRTPRSPGGARSVLGRSSASFAEELPADVTRATPCSSSRRPAPARSHCSSPWRWWRLAWTVVHAVPADRLGGWRRDLVSAHGCDAGVMGDRRDAEGRRHFGPLRLRPPHSHAHARTSRSSTSAGCVSPSSTCARSQSRDSHGWGTFWTSCRSQASSRSTVARAHRCTTESFQLVMQEDQLDSGGCAEPHALLGTGRSHSGAQAPRASPTSPAWARFPGPPSRSRSWSSTGPSPSIASNTTRHPRASKRRRRRFEAGAGSPLWRRCRRRVRQRRGAGPRPSRNGRGFGGPRRGRHRGRRLRQGRRRGAVTPPPPPTAACEGSAMSPRVAPSLGWGAFSVAPFPLLRPSSNGLVRPHTLTPGGRTLWRVVPAATRSRCRSWQGCPRPPAPPRHGPVARETLRRGMHCAELHRRPSRIR